MTPQMPPSEFLPIELGEAVEAEKLEFGVIAFIPSCRHPVMAIQLGDRLAFLDLGGDRPLSVWFSDHAYGPSFAFYDWRLEVDPRSFVDGRTFSPGIGEAFRSADSIGVVGYDERGPGQKVPLALAMSGLVVPTTASPTTRFGRWRILVGSEREPFVLFEHGANPG